MTEREVILRLKTVAGPAAAKGFDDVGKKAQEAGTIVDRLRKQTEGVGDGLKQAAGGAAIFALSANQNFGRVLVLISQVRSGISVVHGLASAFHSAANAVGRFGQASRSVGGVGGGSAGGGLQPAPASSSGSMAGSVAGGAAAGLGTRAAGAIAASGPVGWIAAGGVAAIGASVFARNNPHAMESVSGYMPSIFGLSHDETPWAVRAGLREGTIADRSSIQRHQLRVGSMDERNARELARFQAERGMLGQARAAEAGNFAATTSARLGRASIGIQRGDFAESLAAGSNLFAGARALTPLTSMRPEAQIEQRHTAAAFRQMVEGQSHSEAGADASVKQAMAERTHEMERQIQLQRQLNSAENSTRASAAERYRLQVQLREATERVADAERKVAEAVHSQGQTRRENLLQTRAFLRGQKENAEGRVDTEEARQRDMAESFGAMTGGERAASLNILERLKAGPQKGRGPQMRMVGGRPVWDPGTGSNLSEQERQFASSNPFLQEQLKKFDRASASQDPAFQRLLDASGATQRLAEAKREKEYYAKAETNIDVQIKLDEESLAQQLQEQLIPKIVDQVTKSVNALRQETSTSMDMAEAQRRAAVGKN